MASERGIDAQLECKGSSEHHSLAIRLFPTPESSRHYVRGQCAQLISHKDPFTAWLPLYVRQTNAMTTAPSEVPFHQIAVTACHTSVELQELPWRGFYTDVFGRKEQWDSTTSQMRLQTVKLFKRSSLPSGYLVLYDGDLALLIGSDASGQLAFDVWEPKEGNIQWDGSTFRLLVNDHQGRHSALPRMHNFLQRAFEPSSPGTVMRKLERYNVQVLAEKFYEGRLPVHDLKITRTKKVDEPQSPAARSIPARPKEGRRGLFGHRHRRAQEPSPS